jgi:hypothetical protein
VPLRATDALGYVWRDSVSPGSLLELYLGEYSYHLVLNSDSDLHSISYIPHSGRCALFWLLHRRSARGLLHTQAQGSWHALCFFEIADTPYVSILSRKEHGWTLARELVFLWYYCNGRRSTIAGVVGKNFCGYLNLSEDSKQETHQGTGNDKLENHMELCEKKAATRSE